MTSRLPSVSLIVLNWNGRPYLDACLSALEDIDYPAYAITLVDNASSDDSVSFVRSRFPDITCLENAQNLGYSAGNNVALRTERADIAVIINPDVVVEPGWLQALIAPMRHDPAIGIAGCKLHYPDSTIIQHAGGYVTAPQGFPGHYGLGEEDRGQCDQLRDVDYVIGAVIALRRSMLDRIGLFDEDFFLYFEDTDLCQRAREAGYRVVYVPEAVATHHEAATTEKESPFYLKQIHTGRWRFLLKHLSADMLLSKTMPAEIDWLYDRSATELRALSAAYRNALYQIPSIWRERRRSAMDTNAAASDSHRLDDQQEAVTAGMAELADTTRQLLEPTDPKSNAVPDSDPFDQWRQSDRALQAKSYVVEEPFTSHAPIIGPLLARFRTFWNNFATTWYVRPMLQQQNEYNHLVFERLDETHQVLREMHALLIDLSEWLADSDRDTTGLARKSGELAYRVMILEEQLSAPSDLNRGRAPATSTQDADEAAME